MSPESAFADWLGVRLPPPLDTRLARSFGGQVGKTGCYGSEDKSTPQRASEASRRSGAGIVGAPPLDGARGVLSASKDASDAAGGPRGKAPG